MDKWKGSFAQTQLEKFGWSNGDGLGKNKDGKVKHIAVSVKNDKKGVGVAENQWEFAWWDHLYNKSTNALSVEKDKTEGQVVIASKAKSEVRRSKTGIISTQRPTGKRISKKETVAVVEETEVTVTAGSMSSMAEQRNMMDTVKDLQMGLTKKATGGLLYSAFVKSSTGSLPSSDPSTPTPLSPQTKPLSLEEEELKDFSIKISDAELFAACEGRTARKGGRGLVDQKGKYSRVMQDYLRPDDSDDETPLKKRKRKDNGQNDREKKEKKTKKAKKEKKEKKEKKTKKEKTQ
ncbi:hypothetical protein BDF14DRAFT_1846373 [Spinellus fusiger]|nr:hypothetical protein BDF14DRAFT_1846373 [Spinellus fusiger]